ncbi:MAG: tRNA uracil 4-sulfurtransferase ThiI [Christensenellales bacterium]
MRNVLLIRYGEVHLKGQNRGYFMRLLKEDIEHALSDMGAVVSSGQGRFYASGYPNEREDEAVRRITRILGLHSVSRAREVEKDFDAIFRAAKELMERELQERGGSCTFKVFARRSDKTFPMDSMTIAKELGHVLLQALPGLKVDVVSPDVSLSVEVREQAYVYSGEEKGAGGMPAGSNGKAALLLSGGIDSPVAGYMVMKRGVDLHCVHFHSFPYTSERAKDKVIALAKLLAGYGGSVVMHVVHFTEIQMELYEKCPDNQTTILMRRAMMAIAERIAKANGCQALVTGEAIGQVASQTMDSLVVTDDAVSMPVFRPCIGMDKSEIMEYAKKIGTYETSILPYEDCCTIFTPRHPVTKPKLEDIKKSESRLEHYEELLQAAIEKTETFTVTP